MSQMELFLEPCPDGGPMFADPTIMGYPITTEILQYVRHANGSHDHMLPIDPMPTPRPRGRAIKSKYSDKAFVQFYHPTEYTAYKGSIAFLAKKLVFDGTLKPGEYSKVFVTFYMAYPKSTPKKNLIEGADHKKKPDFDNLIKGLLDGLADAGILITGDGALSDGSIRKRYTTQPEGRIEFTLS